MNRATSRGDRVLRGALWLIGVPLLRWRARRRIDRLAPGVVTVVTVNWNSYGYLASSLDVGTVFGDFVYHNFYATRFAATERPVLDRVVRRDDPAAAWAEALERYS